MSHYTVIDLLPPYHNQIARLFFELNGDTVEFKTHGPVDMVWWPCTGVDYKDVLEYSAKLKLCLDIAHASENKIKGCLNTDWINQPFCNDYILVECEDPGAQHPKIISSKFIFNRSKAYYDQRQFTNGIQPWYLIDSADFLLPKLDIHKTATKIFLSPNKVYRDGQHFREQLGNALQHYQELGWQGTLKKVYSNTRSQNWQGRLLAPNRFMPDSTNPCDLAEIEQHLTLNELGYSPVHNAYYMDSYISIYAETMEHGTTVLTTEKTFDPLIKGHFILPFGTAGLIANIQELGFELPGFIDYSYDQEATDSLRFQLYQQEIKRLLGKSLDEWQQHWVDNFEIIKHNRSVFENTPYYRIEFEQLMESK